MPIYPSSECYNVATRIRWVTALERIVYFSYSTLTTRGYGDITPVSPGAQSLVAIESMAGLLDIAIIIGRLISVYRRA